MNLQKGKEFMVGKNRIFLDDNNVVNFIHVGEMNEEIAIDSIEAMRELQRIGGKKINFLIDFNKAGKGTAKGRRLLKEFTENQIDGKLAFYGLHPVARVIASFFMGTTKKDEMRFLKTKEDALEWFNE